MSPSRGMTRTRRTLLLAICTVVVLHLVVYRSTAALRTQHVARLNKRGHPDTPPDTDALIDWLSIYRHLAKERRPALFAVMTLWLVFLFAFVGICASEFFCPNLSHIASRLGLSESVAGVTFLAFSNGSPDVFSTFSALRADAGALAIGELIGAASFIVSVVAGTMALITPFRVSKHTFLRDVGFFTVAVLMTLGILYDSHIHLWEALAMVALYTVYVAYVAIGGWWWSRREEHKRTLRQAREEYDHRATAGHDHASLEGLDALEAQHEDDTDEDEFENGAEIAWEPEHDQGLIYLPGSGATTPISPSSPRARPVSPAFSSDSIVYHSSPHQHRSRSVRSIGAITPPLSHSHGRSRSYSLANPNTAGNRPPPVPLLTHHHQYPYPIQPSTVSSNRRSSKARPSLLGAIEFRDLVNSLNSDQNNATNLLSVFGSASGGPGAGPKLRKGKRPGHSRTNTNHSLSTNASAATSENGLSPANERANEHEWDWSNGWSSTENQFGRGRRRASSSPGDRPLGVLRGGNLRLEGDDDTLAQRILNDTRNRSVLDGPSSGNDTESHEENPWAQENVAKKEVRRVPSIMLTSETGSDTLIPGVEEVGTSDSSITSSSTVRPGSATVPARSSPLSSSTMTPPSPASSSSTALPTSSERPRGTVSNRLLLRSILSALFPSLDQFGSKSIVGKLTALMCVPALLVLNLTLPVAEEVTEDQGSSLDWGQDGLEKEEDNEATGLPKGIRLPDDGQDNDGTLLGEEDHHFEGGQQQDASTRVGKKLHSPAIAHPHSHHLSNAHPHPDEDVQPSSGGLLLEDSPPSSPWIDQQASANPDLRKLDHQFRIASGSEETVNRANSECSCGQDGGIACSEGDGREDEAELERLECEAARKVTRGLTAVQCTLGPVFCAFALLANDLQWYQPIVALLIGLFFATLAYRFFHNPRHPGRVSLCFLGFGIAMVWILMIVNEVVGVLQTLGHIFGISDAILGLTIFAMGNSLGDLVANATVARMGYPSMAIAACFGGPMLNILLGVGLSGTYLIATSPTREPIHIDMGRTLLVSGIGLFAILVGSLVVVPLNGYRMSKRIGAILIFAYTVVLSINIAAEIFL
ncbi:uncharacterized protein JCM15063_002741 [Sporobolomyces koalae]|uniref:uncharacterized protein n=1 Tax=Sporobolomyces koalae TaxID=500713 RepID=UPI00316BD1CA